MTIKENIKYIPSLRFLFQNTPKRDNSRIMNPRIFPLELREIDLESFQQLNIADSQEELQKILLLKVKRRKFWISG